MEDKGAKSVIQNEYFSKILRNSILTAIDNASESQKRLRVILTKRNKKLIDGDYIVFIPKEARKSVPCADDVGDDEDLGSKFLVNLNEFCQNLKPCPVNLEQTNSSDKKNINLFLKLRRKEVFQILVNQILQLKDKYGHSPGENILVNCIAKQSEHGDLSLDGLRSLVLAEHISQLLVATGNSPFVHTPAYDHTKTPQIDISFREKIELSEEDLKQTSKSLINRLKSNEYRHSQDKDTDIVLDLKKYIDSNNLGSKRDGFDKNIKLANFSEQNVRFKELVQIDAANERITASACIHVVPSDCEYVQQQVDLGCRIAGTALVQQHVVMGKVTSRKLDGVNNAFPSLQDFFKLRLDQMREAAILKYGDQVQGSGWDETIHSLTMAGIKFELLGTSVRNQCKLDLSENNDGTPVDTKGGVFVMYNYARLATLFHNFEQAVSRGQYPELPTVESVDFGLLKDEEEWSLAFNYLLTFPTVIEESMPQPTHDVMRPQIHTHKVCQFLCDLSRDLSSYYRRVRILTEARPHLYPTMHARLYLMKAVQRVMLNALTLLNITPLPQL